MSDQRCSDNNSDQFNSKRETIPSFIEPRPPLILNPFMRPRPQKGTNLLYQFEEDSESDEAEWVQVYLRLKPCEEKSGGLYEVKSDRRLITSVDTATAGHGRRTQHHVSKEYTFSHIFGPESTQKEIFEHVVKDNLKRLPEGHNFTLLTYGASGSGKTYTLMGTVASPGLVPRALEYVFRLIEAAQQPIFKQSDGGAEKLTYGEQEYELQFVKRIRQVSAPLRDKYRRMSMKLQSDLTQSTFDLTNRTRYYVWVSFVEIYNEGIYDLLTLTERTKASSLRIREDSNGNAYVKGATQVFVRSGEEAYDIMVAGKHNLQVAATGVHAHSSRSHCIFTITMLTETDNGVRTSCVRLCDLAGCERAQKTKNTGARMQESRAINTSLHVLERCLHMLRKKQRQRVDSTLVPYRESKLTRLLGAGLSGARGEAVSMVVTLNPAPQYAHETKHVLQLAVVAKDIQVNHTTTIAESLEYSSSNTTVGCSEEVMRLRADNERLQFELVQAQARNKELWALMEDKQLETAKLMTEMVEKAKDLTEKYYEGQLLSLRTEMEEMQEVHETRLAELQSVVDTERLSTSSRSLQKEVEKLMTTITILEEKIMTEKLARARAEEEIQRLLACIEERDEKAEQSEDDDVNAIVLSDDDEADSEDSESNCESLEPKFKKEEINRSRLLQKSLLSYNSMLYDNNDDENVEETVINDSSVQKSDGTIKDDDISKDETANMTGVHEFTDNFDETFTNTCNYKDVPKGVDIQNNVIECKNDNIDKNTFIRGTYFVRNSDKYLDNKDVSKESNKTQNDIPNYNQINNSSAVRGTYFVTDSDKPNKNTSGSNPKTSERGNFVLGSKSSENKRNNERNVSLVQFELLEKVANISDPKANITEPFGDMNIQRDNRIFFDNKPNEAEGLIIGNIETNKTYFDNIVVKVDKNKNDANYMHLNDDRSPSIVQDEVKKDFEPNKFKILLGESFKRQPDMSSVHEIVMPKKHVSVDLFECHDSPIVKPTDTNKIGEKDDSQIIVQKDNENAEPESFWKTEMVEKAKMLKVVLDPKDIITYEKLHHTEKIDVPVKAKATDESIILESSQKMIIETGKTDSKPKSKDIASIGEPSINNESQLEQIKSKNNTVDEFEKIYKDITIPQATEFEQLISQELSSTHISDIPNTESTTEAEMTTYNLRRKENTSKKEEDKHELNPCEIQTELKPPKRNLRLRRRKNQEVDEKRQENVPTELKDITNLQKEFSDVTLDVPVAKIEVKDIQSPEQCSEEDEKPPMKGAQSCPSKSITRSRRKLFTPRAEVQEESLDATGDSDERVCVPRPSYHRPRARRRL